MKQPPPSLLRSRARSDRPGHAGDCPGHAGTRMEAVLIDQLSDKLKCNQPERGGVSGPTYRCSVAP
eukprot:240945-Chlamydomonas_euryale.AAC.5